MPEASTEQRAAKAGARWRRLARHAAWGLAALSLAVLLLTMFWCCKHDVGPLLADGFCMSDSAWRRRLEQSLLPVFTNFYAQYGEPPAVAAAYGAQAAFLNSKRISHKVAVALFAAAVSFALSFIYTGICTLIRQWRKGF